MLPIPTFPETEFILRRFILFVLRAKSAASVVPKKFAAVVPAFPVTLQAPPEASDHDKFPAPSVTKACPTVPSTVGNA